MRKMLPVLILWALQSLSFAQGKGSFLSPLNDSVVAKYNGRDFYGIYALGNDQFKTVQEREDFKNLLSSLYKATGEIVNSVPIGAYPHAGSFQWIGEKKNLRLDLSSRTGTDISELTLNDFIEQPFAPARKVLSDNRLISHIDSVVDRNARIYMQDPGSVGLSISIFKKGKRYTYDYGEVKKGTGQLPNARTFYELGSITKTFVGILLARAVVEKKARLDDDIRKYLKGAYPNLQYEGHPIELVHLANHSSGLPYWTITRPDSLDQLAPYKQHLFYEKYTLKHLARDLHTVTIDTVPGVRFNYSAAGINTLIIILQNIYKKSFERLVKDYFGKRFGMVDTKKALTSGEIRRYVTGYDERGLTVPYFVQNTAALGPELASTVEDMLKYVELNVREANTAIKLSHQKTLGLAGGYGLGLGWMMNNNWQGDHYLFHNGQGWGCISTCTFYPRWQTGYVIFVNEKRSQERVGALERNLSEALNER